MKARAPGKLVLSGAYAVLEGAPAIVTAVDRYVVADSSRPAEFVSEEMRAAGPPPYPHFDATELRRDGRKLGLGSSAAILVATLATRSEFDVASSRGRDALFTHALFAHRAAQGGGSGIDVAASVYGGTLRFQLPRANETAQRGLASTQREHPRIEALRLPGEIRIDVLASTNAASTSHFVSRVHALRERDAKTFAVLLRALWTAAEAAVQACEADSAKDFIAALDRQGEQLALLGSAAALPIVPPEIEALRAWARARGGCALPAGAGGGDVSLVVSSRDVPGGEQRFGTELDACAAEHGLTRLEMALDAPGVTRPT